MWLFFNFYYDFIYWSELNFYYIVENLKLNINYYFFIFNFKDNADIFNNIFYNDINSIFFEKKKELAKFIDYNINDLVAYYCVNLQCN